MQVVAVDDANDLIQLSVDEVTQWLEQVLLGAFPEPTSFNWLGLAQSTKANATTEEHDRSVALAWGKISLTAYTRYAIRQTSRESPDLSAMHLRAALISRFGHVPGDPILDAEIVLKWVFTGAYTYEQAIKTLAEVWPPLDQAQAHANIGPIRELRRIKTRLNIVQLLVDSGRWPRDSALDAWLTLKPQLP